MKRRWLLAGLAEIFWLMSCSSPGIPHHAVRQEILLRCRYFECQNAVQSLIRLVMLMKKKESIFTLLTLNHGDPPRNEFLITSPFLQWIWIIYSSFMHSWVWIFLFRQHLMCFQGAHLNDSSFFKAFSPALVCSTFTFCCFSVKSLKLAPSASSLLDHLSIKCFASAYLQLYAFSSFPELLPAVLRL